MSEQRTDAAERSAHVTRGSQSAPTPIAADAAPLPPLVLEYKNAAGQLVGELRVVHDLRAQVQRLRSALEPFASLAKAFSPESNDGYVFPEDQVVDPVLDLRDIKQAAVVYNEPTL